MLRKRITTFIVAFLFTTFFIAAATLAIFFAQGRKLDITEGVIQTSIINLNSLPDEVNVFVNDKRVDRVDGRIENLDPGTIKLRVEKDGYTTWEKDVVLQAGVVKDINVQLFPNNLDLSALTVSNIDKAVFTKDSEYIFYSVLNETNPGDKGIWKLKLSRNILNLTENKPVKILPIENDKAIELKTSDYVIKVSRDNSRFLIFSPSLQLLEVYDANTGRIVEIQNILNSFPSQVDWFNGSSALVFDVNNLIYEYDIGSKQLTIVTFNSDSDPIYAVSSSRIIYFNKVNSKYYSYKNKGSTELELFTQNINAINPSRILLSDSNEDVIAILGVNKSLTFFDEAKLYQAAFQDIDLVVNINNPLTEYVLVKGSDMYALYLEPTVDNKSYNATLSNLKTTTTGVVYSTILENSNSITFIKKLDNISSTLTIMDKDGENLKDFFNDERLSVNPIAISPNGSELYLVLHEKSGESVVDNLYKLILLK
ncbi:MAG: carboxypeptidase-like regulatory domain-containing protein [Candidatus Dojkabacteria bacterium]